MSYESTATKIWRVIYPVLLHIAIYALVLFGFSILFSTLGYRGEDVNQQMNTYAAIMTGIALVITIPILYFFYRKDYPVKSGFLFRNPKYILLILVLAVAASHGLSLLLSLFSTGSLAEGYETVENAIYASSPVLVIIRGVLLAPLCEELIFRGLMFRRLKEYTSFWVAALISSVVFAVYHMNLIQGIFAFLFGLILCFIYDKFQNLWASIFLHAAGNLLSVILTYTAFQYPSMTVYVIAMAVFLLLALWLCFFVFRKVKAD